MSSLREGRRRIRPVTPWPDGHRYRPGATRGMAIDLGSSRTRAWVPGQGLVRAPAAQDDGTTGRPVRRGRIVDPESCGRLLGRIADEALGADRGDTVIVLSHPVLAGTGHRAMAREMLAGPHPTRVVVLSSARAAAAHAGPEDGGPVLVIDMGAELTEVTLLVDGTVADARQAETGLSDLAPEALATELVRTVVDMVSAMWRQDTYGAMRGALRKGPVLTGGGALNAVVTERIALCLGSPVRLSDDPSTSVVRGAGLLLGAVLRHPASAAARPGRAR